MYDPTSPTHDRRHACQELLCTNTQRSYVHYVAEFARYYKAGPEYLSFEHVRAYQVYLAEQRQLSPASVNVFVAAAQFLYTVTLEMPWGAEPVRPHESAGSRCRWFSATRGKSSACSGMSGF